MTLAEVVLSTLFGCLVVFFVLCFVAHTMTILRLRREHSERWESLGRPYPLVPPMDPQSKAAQREFFWNRGYETVDDPTLQSYAQIAHALAITGLIVLAITVIVFLYKHYALQ